ncbi:MAG TPA: GNAT family N-acetyltransferase [Thermoanaerobaculia bacterium]|nr:GNAT family N-acetyltransferase [Thermoanaerobaculia bacterium]
MIPNPPSGLTFRRLTEPRELEQVHRLNYRTFVEEIPQHGENAERLLRDPRLDRSVPFGALSGDRLCGMMAISAERPFSLDAKLPDLDGYLPPHESPCEIRLLAVEPDRRGGRIFAGLLGCLVAYCREVRHDLAVISGTERQARLYAHLGFVPFGPPIGTERAPYRAMYLTWDRLAPSAFALAERSGSERGA